MNQRAMYGSSTAACSVNNIPSTSNLPQQHSGNVQPTPTMYYVSQLPAENYGQQQIFPYAGDSFAQQQDGVPIKEVYQPNATNTINRHIYSYNLLPTNQTDFTSNVHPHQQYSTQPPSIQNQNQSTAAQQILSQPSHHSHHSHQINHNQSQQHQFNATQPRPSMISAQTPQIHSSSHQTVNHQLPNLMHPPPYAQKRDPQQTYPLNVFHNNSNPATYQTMPPNQQKMHPSIHNNNGNGHNNGQDQRAGRLSTMFDTTADNYTASWVSSTSSIPPDQKIPPDNNSPTNTFEFNNWTANEKSKMVGDNQQAQSSAIGSNISPNVHSASLHQNNHVYAGQQHPQFRVPTTTHSTVQHVPYYPNQHQFAPPANNFSFYQMPPQQQYMGPPYFMPGHVQGGMPNFMQGYAHQPYMPPAMAFNLVPPLNPLFPVEARPLNNDQNERFDGTWLDQSKNTQQELDIQKEMIPIAIEHNSRQMTGANSGHRSGLLGAISQQLMNGMGNEPRDNRYINRKPKPFFRRT